MLDQTIRDYMSKLGKKSAESLTVEQRKERAKKAITKRWENYYSKKNCDIITRNDRSEEQKTG